MSSKALKDQLHVLTGGGGSQSSLEEPKLVFKNCCNCKRPVFKGYYGSHTETGGGTCSKKCDDEYETTKKPRFLGK